MLINQSSYETHNKSWLPQFDNLECNTIFFWITESSREITKYLLALNYNLLKSWKKYLWLIQKIYWSSWKLGRGK